MPPPGYEPFLRAICENPADDAPRLVYADWLEEHGDPERAEFIRVQIRLAQSDGDGYELAALRVRERALRRTREDDWRRELPTLSGVQWQGFARGFVNRVSVMHHKWLRESAEPLFAVTPVESLSIFGMNDQAALELTRLPYLPRLASLEVNEFARGMDQRGWMMILECPGLINLRDLTIRGTRSDRSRWFEPGVIDSPVAQLICLSRLSGQLDQLLVDRAATDEAIEILRSHFGPRLEVRGRYVG